MFANNEVETKGLRLINEFKQRHLEFFKQFREYSDTCNEETIFLEIDKYFWDHLMLVLVNNELPLCQIEILGILKNFIRIKESKITDFIDQGIIKILIKILNSPKKDISEAVLLLLNVIIRHSEIVLRYCIGNGILQPLLAILNSNQLESYELIASLYCSLSTYYSFERNDTILLVLDGLKKLLQFANNDPDTIYKCLHACYHFIRQRERTLDLVIKSEMIPIILKCIYNSNTFIQSYTVNMLTSIAYGSLSQLNHLLNNKFLSCIQQLLSSNEATVIIEALSSITVIATTGGPNVRKIISENIQLNVMHLIENCTDQRIRLKASNCLHSIIHYAFPEDLTYLANSDFIKFLLNNVTADCQELYFLCLKDIINKSSDKKLMIDRVVDCADNEELKEILRHCFC